jgi:hypothetical protein
MEKKVLLRYYKGQDVWVMAQSENVTADTPTTKAVKDEISNGDTVVVPYIGAELVEHDETTHYCCVVGTPILDEETNIPVSYKEVSTIIAYTEEQIEANKEQSRQREIKEAKEFLNSTDWEVTKCVEKGGVFEKECPELFKAREDARDRINELE